jgi:hypothetical protein
VRFMTQNKNLVYESSYWCIFSASFYIFIHRQFLLAEMEGIRVVPKFLRVPQIHFAKRPRVVTLPVLMCVHVHATHLQSTLSVVYLQKCSQIMGRVLCLSSS